MAATDKPFRDQRVLDIVFAVSNILMLLSVVWMMYQDYAREYKAEQRAFRDVEVNMAQRQALEQIPSMEDFKQAEEKVAKAREERAKHTDALASARADMARLQPQRERADAAYQAVKADVDSITSFLNIALEHGDAVLAQKYTEQLKSLDATLIEKQDARDKIVNEMKLAQMKIEDIEGPYTRAAAEFKKVNDKLDTQVKLAITKRWGFGDWLRTQPVINGFADPLRIHQFTINEIPIDYNFKYVTRYDRCMTCHLGIDRPAYTRENLTALLKEDSHQKELETARELYKKRLDALDPSDPARNMIPNPNELNLSALSDSKLTPSRIAEFAAHPRLDLFVGSNSKHSAERFGCSSCHYGQGSGTTFIDSSHSPNSSDTRAAWKKNKHWEPNHMWDFPMLPTRFIESSCIKCHHEVTDLISSDNRVEAPKVLRGYNLIKENGCFGCHEISGWKGANRVGPDLRLEPNPPLEDLTPIERTRAINDPDNRPGGMRKVGPALSRVSEKIDSKWIEKWLYSPTSFRPDTKMPHYYNLSTNNAEALKGTGQEKFPNAEIASIAYFLDKTSKAYLGKAEAQRQKDAKDADAKLKDDNRLAELLTRGRLGEADQKEFAALKERIRLRKEAKLVDLAPNYKGNAQDGKKIFVERGCLSCHTHQGTAPEIMSEASFGPDLSQVPAKFGKSKEARTWLIQWIINPQAHSPRSRMPQTHLTPTEAADVAAWLLEQKAIDLGDGWDKDTVTPPARADLEELAKVYLVRMLSKSDMERFLKGMPKEDLAKFRANQAIDPTITVMLNDVADDEKKLYEEVNDDTLKYYLGKKAVNRLGCYGCHDIPGFETTKSIGVALNDWGKKPADRLAFEDIGNFFDKHYYKVKALVDEKGNLPGKDEAGKEPYEQFYADSLLGHTHDRIGYLNQKIRDPRSYDYNRIRTWDDRARMPKFHLARQRKVKDEEDVDYQKRAFKSEAEAREAVATFVLGLVAEQVPVKNINQPTGDRLAEVKGRQILDKYNCGGCHLIRPGVFDFKVGPKTAAKMETAFRVAQENMEKTGEIDVANHINWVGRNTPNTKTAKMLTSYAVQPAFRKIENDEDTALWLSLNLSEALRFTDTKGAVRNIPAGQRVDVAVDELPGGASIQNQADVERYFKNSLAYGGTFSDIMIRYLNKKDAKKYPLDPYGDSGDARASLPPVLIGQGERTQPDWLYQFLLNPQKVRKLSILRMPKFNMSNEEAEILVDYFAGVTRQINPGIGLNPHEANAQREDLDGPYWQAKTAEYVKRLRAMPARDMDGKILKDKDGKDMTAYEQRIAEYTPVWEKLVTEKGDALKADLKKLADFNAARAKDIELKEQALKDKKGDAATVQKEIDTLKQALKDSDAEKAKLEAAIQQLDIKSMRQTWEEKEAYLADGYRLVASRKLCTQCHQVGNLAPSEKDKQGPPLALAHNRLRPNWIENWVNKPQRFVPYASMMPPYFHAKELKYQPILAGPAHEQLHAVRDILMNFPRIAEMPVNRLYNPDATADKK